MLDFCAAMPANNAPNHSHSARNRWQTLCAAQPYKHTHTYVLMYVRVHIFGILFIFCVCLCLLFRFLYFFCFFVLLHIWCGGTRTNVAYANELSSCQTVAYMFLVFVVSLKYCSCLLLLLTVCVCSTRANNICNLLFSYALHIFFCFSPWFAKAKGKKNILSWYGKWKLLAKLAKVLFIYLRLTLVCLLLCILMREHQRCNCGHTRASGLANICTVKRWFFLELSWKCFVVFVCVCLFNEKKGDNDIKFGEFSQNLAFCYAN